MCFRTINQLYTFFKKLKSIFFIYRNRKNLTISRKVLTVKAITLETFEITFVTYHQQMPNAT